MFKHPRTTAAVFPPDFIFARLLNSFHSPDHHGSFGSLFVIACVTHRWKELAKKGKEKQIPLRDDDKNKIEELSDKLKSAVKSKETAKSNEDKLLAATAIEDARTAIKQVTP